MLRRPMPLSLFNRTQSTWGLSHLGPLRVLIVVLRGTTKDAERASKARSKHSTHSGHSMIKPVANSAAYNFWLSYNANNSPKTRAFVRRDCASETGKAKPQIPRFWPVCRLGWFCMLKNRFAISSAYFDQIPTCLFQAKQKA